LISADSAASRDRTALLLLDRVREHPGEWQLHGALLAEVDRILDELAVEKRSERLVEELDRYPRMHLLKRRLGSARDSAREALR